MDRLRHIGYGWGPGDAGRGLGCWAVGGEVGVVGLDWGWIGDDWVGRRRNVMGYLWRVCDNICL